MSIIDEKINNGYDAIIAQAFADYMHVPLEAITVENDMLDAEYTLIRLINVNPQEPRLRLGLHELGRHEHAEIEVTGEGKLRKILIRILDTNIEGITEFMRAKKKKKAAE